ncbi:SDR family NAD(P)-dependent oxidoreductase [Aspergillus alliaceus]|uniref:SDR family NAD(P)-dependent oxidoreductase n=1 Tax=Petromyces alliaceus TaxID=209559 RepID=UPI0012A49110|nr:uncharacterized protein BDW43DRAFT_306626 [Aspergillus alliaceus]KAB8237926.1 hypothetical protein BDW43DRAFT_306626 [Aspergillus alliaceus]
MNRDGLSNLVDELSEEEKARVITRAVGITNRSAVASFLHLTKAHFGKIDGIANSAGTAGHKLGHQEVWEMDEKEQDFMMGVNVKGVFNVLSEDLSQDFCRSQGALSMQRVWSPNVAFRKALCLAPVYTRGGPIDTLMLRANEESGAEGTAPAVPLGRLGVASETANVVTFLLSDEASFVTGATWSVDGWANAQNAVLLCICTRGPGFPSI